MGYGETYPAGGTGGVDESGVAISQQPGAPLGPYTASGKIVTGPGRLIGFSLRATTATVAVGQLYDGEGTGGQMVADIDASQGDALVCGPCDPGVALERGLYFNLASGSASLVVWWVPE